MAWFGLLGCLRASSSAPELLSHLSLIGPRQDTLHSTAYTAERILQVLAIASTSLSDTESTVVCSRHQPANDVLRQ